MEQVRILCFGASITAGFHAFGLRFHPYAIQLQRRLDQVLAGTKVNIQIDGLPGDRVIQGSYFRRLESRCQKDQHDPYDWIIVQGGGNDLGSNVEPARIFEELKKVWRMALDSGAKVLALTVTDTSDQSKRTRVRYSELNNLILNHHEERFYVADVCSRIPYASTEETMRRKIWDDGLHFRAEGYDTMGDAIADRLLGILHSQPGPKI